MAARYGVEANLFLLLIVFLALGWLTFLLRVWVKLKILKSVSTDDYLMLGAILLFSGFAAAGLYGIVETKGGRDPNMTPQEASTGLYAWWLWEVLYVPVTVLSRTSVAVFLRRIAVRRLHRKIITCVVAAFWATAIPLFVVLVFQCHPVSFFWKQPLSSTTPGSCMNPHIIFVVLIVQSVVSTCSDMTLGILPMAMLWKVQLSLKTKLALCVMLGMGMLAGIALIVRVAYLRPNNDFSATLGQTMNVANWSVLEPGICIVGGCLVTLRPLISRQSRANRRPVQSPTTYRRTFANMGLTYALDPNRMKNEEDAYANALYQMHGLLRSPEPSGFDFRRGIGLWAEQQDGADLLVATNQTQVTNAEPSNADSNQSVNDDGNDAVVARTPSSLARRSSVSRSSIDSNMSLEFIPISFTWGGGQQSHRNQNRLLHQQPPESSRASLPPSSPVSTLPSPPPPAALSVLSPSNQILVTTTTEVDYSGGPSVSVREAEESSTALDELPTTMAFHGAHSVQISAQRVTVSILRE
ncbi:integral membrane protein [Niveomyces insectorum RCEF 264]|uniref:Integral membrane protein n=1 Tax=Niveomyces insectorum RCEF 264 TaxID=1081102 RepID=A0A167MU06_9HYPO|nr:integral membrane protein [Niveomyces insectorum RCEF 264]